MSCCKNGRIMNACSLSTSIALTVLGSFKGREANVSDNVFLSNTLHLASLGAVCSGIWVNVKQSLLPRQALYMGIGASIAVPLALRSFVHIAHYTGVCVKQAECLESSLGKIVDIAVLIASVAALILCSFFLQQAYKETVFFVIGSVALVGINTANWLGLLKNN